MELSANELRIGNYVSSILHRNKFFVIRGIGKAWVNFEGISITVTIPELEPIPLTEEWLLKCGAVKLDFKTFPSFNLFGMQINFVDGIWKEYVHQVELKGLHHLQNLFFFSRNEELTIK